MDETDRRSDRRPGTRSGLGAANDDIHDNDPGGGSLSLEMRRMVSGVAATHPRLSRNTLFHRTDSPCQHPPATNAGVALGKSALAAVAPPSRVARSA